MSEETEDLQQKILEKLQECGDLLLECEGQNKKCWRCRKKRSCRFFMRSVISALCKINCLSLIPEDPEKNCKMMYS